MKKMFALSLISLLLLLPASALAQAPTPKKPPRLPTGRLGTPNLDRDGRVLNQPVFIIRPVPGGPIVIVPQGTPGSRETFPFTDEPHRLNNPHPMLPNGGLGYALQYIQVPTLQMMLPVYVPGPGSFPGELESQVVEIPGYVVTETTTGYIYPARWGLQQVTIGVYQWVTLPPAFQPK